MFSVEEGEVVLVVFPGGRCWLVDCGNTDQIATNEGLAAAVAAYLNRRSLTLEACVATHSHMDHIGALETLLADATAPLTPVVTVYRARAKWGRGANFLDRYDNMVANSNGHVVERIFEPREADIVNIGTGIDAHFFVGSGASVYTSLFMRLSYGFARLLFTGDADMDYEKRLLAQFSPAHMRADVLKVTHHGSSDGTSSEAVAATRPAFAISSSSDDEDHRLEADTIVRLLDTPVGRRRIFNTAIDGDIVVETDGGAYRRGVLYRVTTHRPGEFAGL